jgi:hypothetical protein
MTREGLRTSALIGTLGYVVIVGVVLLAWNAAGGGMIEAWYDEYVGADGIFSGSGAWRGDERASFRDFALLFGTWVYPLSVISVAAFARRAWRAKNGRERALSVAAVVVASTMLVCFLRLGVFHAVTAD